LPEAAIQFRAIALDWTHAVDLAANLLVASGRAAPEYSEHCVSALTQLGPYQVIAPGLALIHAQTSSAVFETGLSLLTLAEPIEFGHESNDPVRLLFGIAAVDHDSHLELLAELGDFLQDSSNVNFLLNVASFEEFQSYLNGNL
jgi:PTS system ascorbate-specific IIA component